MMMGLKYLSYVDRSAQRQGGFGKTLLWPFSTQGEPKRKLERDILAGPVVIGCGVMVLK